MNKSNNKIKRQFCFYVLSFYFTIFLSGLYADELKEISSFKITAGGQEPLSIATDGSYIYYLCSVDSGAHVSRYTMSGQKISAFDITAGGQEPLSIATDGSSIYYLWSVDSGAHVSRYTMSGQEIFAFDLAAGGQGALAIATDGAYIYYLRAVDSGTYVSRHFNSFRASPVKMPFLPISRTTSITPITNTTPAYQTPLPPVIILRENKQGRR